jgi:hypothetical protein
VGWFLIYMDNGVIHTKCLPYEIEEEHLQQHRKYVHKIFELLEKHDLYLKPEKCIFEREEIKFLGVQVGKGKICMDPEKVNIVKQWPTPWKVTDVRSFLGSMVYY